jgi:hypothetical protein
MYRLLIVLGSILLASLTSCALPARAPGATADASRVIYIVRRDFHTGIAIAAEQWPQRSWPLLTAFPTARYLEFGRGDAACCQAADLPEPSRN